MNEQGICVRERSSRSSSFVNVVLGFWIIISPSVLGLHAPKAIWNNVVIGLRVGRPCYHPLGHGPTRIELDKSVPRDMAGNFATRAGSRHNGEGEQFDSGNHRRRVGVDEHVFEDQHADWNLSGTGKRPDGGALIAYSGIRLRLAFKLVNYGNNSVSRFNGDGL
jgi:hypothetical protein